MSEITDPETADELARDYVCSLCWGALAHVYEDGEHVVKCTNPGCTGEGFVTQRYATKRQEQSYGDKVHARDNLAGILHLPTERKQTPDEILKELGF